MPHHAVGGVPSRSELELLKIGEAQIVAVDVHNVKKETGGPGAYTSAESEGAFSFALDESVRSGGAITCNEIMDTVF